VDFAKGEREDDVMLERVKSFTGAAGVVFIGRSQEKTGLINGASPWSVYRAVRPPSMTSVWPVVQADSLLAR
jgi:hypothetical protein